MANRNTAVQEASSPTDPQSARWQTQRLRVGDVPFDDALTVHGGGERVEASPTLGPSAVDWQVTTVPFHSGHPPFLQVGDIVADAYEVRAFLGAGGMGQVFEAEDIELNRRVAIKIAPPGRAADYLRREGQMLAALKHSSVVTVHSAGRHGDLAYLVLERIRGVSLQAYLDRRRAADQAFSIEEALQLLQMLAEGLSVIHRAGISHRDVKPGNVMLAPGHRLVLMDFGLGRPEADGAPETCEGSPSYMAPEVILQSVRDGEGHLVDLYALGVIAYRLLAGHMPFVGRSSIETLRQHVEAPAPDLRAARPEIPESLAELVAELLQKEPHARPPSAEAVVWQLRAIAAKQEGRKDRLSVLIVDDNRVVTELHRHIVMSAVPGAEIETARDAEEALALYRTCAPDLMLLDLNLPRMSGVDLCVYLHGTGEGRRCTIVAVSGTASEADVRLLNQLGVSHYVAKGPELSEKLTALLRELARRKRAENG